MAGSLISIGLGGGGLVGLTHGFAGGGPQGIGMGIGGTGIGIGMGIGIGIGMGMGMGMGICGTHPGVGTGAHGLGAVLLDLVLPAFGGERGGQALKGVGVQGMGMGMGIGIGIGIGGGGGGGGGGSIITLHGG